jgi:hypothetical protein
MRSRVGRPVIERACATLVTSFAADVAVWNVGGRYGSRGWRANGECLLQRRPSHRRLPLRRAGDEGAKSKTTPPAEIQRQIAEVVATYKSA